MHKRGERGERIDNQMSEGNEREETRVGEKERKTFGVYFLLQQPELSRLLLLTP